MSLDFIGKNPNATPVEFTDTPNFDAFARLRVSNTQPLFDSKQIFDKQPLFWDDQQVSGAGTTSTHSVLKASTTIGVAASTAGKRVRQTFQSFNYQSGKSQLVFMTGTLGASGGGAGIRRAAGLFNDDNGIFFQDDEGVIKACIRSKATGSVVDNKVAQTSWNLDKMDGAGPSGVTLDATKSQIIIFDFEWLGVGRVRMGFVINGSIVYVHEFNHANITAGVYMSTPNLPLRYEIENTGAGAASTLETICATVMAEGGTEKTGSLFHYNSPESGNLSSGGNKAMLGMRLKTAAIGSVVELVSVSMITGGGADRAAWEVTLNPVVAGTFNFVGVTNSTIEIAEGALNTNTLTGGVTIDGGYFTGDQATTEDIATALRLGASIAGVRDVLVISVIPLTNNINVNASITWRELT